MIDKAKTQRLEELDNKQDLTEDERQEWIKLTEENTDQQEITDFESLEQIKKERELQPLKDEAERLEFERKRFELKLQIKIEKDRIESAKNQLAGLIYCDDCKKWVEPSHFDKN